VLRAELFCPSAQAAPLPAPEASEQATRAAAAARAAAQAAGEGNGDAQADAAAGGSGREAVFDDAGAPLVWLGSAELIGLEARLVVDPRSLADTSPVLTLRLEPSGDVSLLSPPGTVAHASLARAAATMDVRLALRCAVRYFQQMASELGSVPGGDALSASAFSAGALLLSFLERHAAAIQCSAHMRISASHAAGDASDLLLHLCSPPGKTEEAPLSLELQLSRADVEEELLSVAVALQSLFEMRDRLSDALLGEMLLKKAAPEPSPPAVPEPEQEPVAAPEAPPSAASVGGGGGFQLPFQSEIAGAWQNTLRVFPGGGR
jgi:hypothetical protein